MREIKFRAWNKNKAEMVWVESIFPQDMAVIPQRKFGKRYTLARAENHSVLMQFTGLKDKNGKEIYEGDILQQRNYYGEKMQLILIKWPDYLYLFYDSEMPTMSHEVEIIGNIYENPELIK